MVCSEWTNDSEVGENRNRHYDHDCSGSKSDEKKKYHPATNGAAERMVKVLKKSLKLASRLSVKHLLNKLASELPVHATLYNGSASCSAISEAATEDTSHVAEARSEG